MVSRIVRDDEIAGSSPVTSTKKQPKTSYFDLFSAVFICILLKNDSFWSDHMFAQISNLWTAFYRDFSFVAKNLFFAYYDANFEG